MERRVLVDRDLLHPGLQSGLGQEAQDGLVAAEGRDVDRRVMLTVQDVDLTRPLHQQPADLQLSFPGGEM